MNDNDPTADHWLPITAYDRVAAPDVLLRNGAQARFGSWRRRSIFVEQLLIEGSNKLCWRSHEDSTLECEISFEPVEFCVLDERAALLYAWTTRLAEIPIAR